MEYFVIIIKGAIIKTLLFITKVAIKYNNLNNLLGFIN
jgi:hypothetical protein